MQSPNSASFDTARQIGTVYSVFAGEDLRTLLGGFVTQAEAMSILFAAAGGLIEAQDEAVAVALGKAAAEPEGLKSVGLMSMLASRSGPVASTAALMAASGGTAASAPVGGYGRVGPEDVSATPLERIVSAAEVLDPAQFAQVQQQVSAAARTLDSAASTLRRELGDVLGSSWQGEFAQRGTAMSEAFTESAFELAAVLEQVATRADSAHVGFDTTRSRITTESTRLTIEQAQTPGLGTGPGATFGPADPGAIQAAAAARAAAEEQARAVVNTEYSPAVMNANLDDLDFPTAFRVVSTTALGGPGGLDPLSAWNIGGTPRVAGAASPDQSALAAAGVTSGSAPEDANVPSADSTVPQGATLDPTTHQALMGARSPAADSAGPGALTGVTGPSASGTGASPVNAATTASGTPLAPVTANSPQTSGGSRGATPSAIPGLRGAGGASGSRDRDRGFGSAAGLVGGGGAAAAGSGAARMGGAGTLAGLGNSAGPGGGIPSGGVPGAGAGTAGGAGVSAGATGSTSSSLSGNTAGRPGAVPMGMMNAGATGQGAERRGHTPAGYLTNATNSTELVGDPVKVAPAVLGRVAEAAADSSSTSGDDTGPEVVGRVIGARYTGGGTAKW